MNNIRKLFGLLVAAVALAAFALPASADKLAQETICPSASLNATPICSSGASLTRGGLPQSSSFQLNNVSNDTGNSTAKAFKLFAPVANGITIATAAGVLAGNSGNVSFGGFTATVQVLGDGSAVYVSNINLPVKPFGPALVLPMTVNVACTATNSATWTTMSGQPPLNQVWTSTNFTGQTFALNTTAPYKSQLTQTVTGACTYTIGGSVSNLISSGLVLQNNGGDNLSVAANATSFTFGTALATGSNYSVTVSQQPTGQNCTVANGTGTVGTANVTNVSVACTNNPYTIGGSLLGLGTGKSVVLQDNGGDNKTLTADGGFTFATSILYGSSYAVTVFTQPDGQTCKVTNGSGTVGAANVTNVSVICGTLDCNTATNPTFPPDPLAQGYFTGSPGITNVAVTGYAAGYRVKDPNKNVPCNLVNQVFTNNITGTGNVTDQNGNIIPPNAASLVWNEAATPDGTIFAYMLTYKAEYAGSNGLPVRQTKFCKLTGPGTDCRETAIPLHLYVLQGCLDPELSFDSLPGTDPDPACLLGETWATVDPSECAGLTNPNGANPPPACLKATDTILEGTDPPIVR